MPNIPTNQYLQNIRILLRKKNTLYTHPLRAMPPRIAKSASKAKASSSKKKAAKSLTKTQMVGKLSESSGLTRAQVNIFLESLIELVQDELRSGRPFNIRGLARFSQKITPATEARTMKNPFKAGEMMVVKAKPERKLIRARVDKALKMLLV